MRGGKSRNGKLDALPPTQPASKNHGVCREQAGPTTLVSEAFYLKIDRQIHILLRILKLGRKANRRNRTRHFSHITKGCSTLLQ